MLTRKIVLLLLSVTFVFAQKSNVDVRYQAAERTFDSYNGKITTTQIEDNSSPTFSSSYHSNGDDAQASFSVLVLPAQDAKNISELEIIVQNPYSKFLMECLNEFFSEKKYDLKILEEQKDLENFILTQNALSGKDEDVAYLTSLYIGADVYVKFSGDISSKKVKIQLNAFESTTGRLIGSSVSDIDVSNLKDEKKFIKVAAVDAGRKLEPKLKSFYASQGSVVQYRVLMNVAGEFDEDFIENLHEYITTNIQGMFKKVVFNVMTEKTIDLTISVNPSDYSNSPTVYSAIRSKLKSVVGVKKTNITKKLIFLDLM